MVRIDGDWPDDRPQRWGTLLERLLQQNPADRFASYDELLSELDRLTPVTSPSAGRIARGIGWLLDSMTASVVGSLPLLAWALYQGLTGNLEGDLRLNGADSPVALIGVALMTWLHLRWGTSAGKKLLHLQIVDQFGLPPARWKVATKAMATYALFWAAALRHNINWLAIRLQDSAGRSVGVMTGIVIVAVALTVINGLWLLFSRQRRTLLNRILGLRVTLRTR
ncbi:MAG: RDD family protein [Planctomycetaceae bacterium]|nr:RDD family protein [Planctomycetaceae bacterium]